ncbi:MAG: hypothetical protein RLY31_1557 [Bacteroidota bacterium]|jgi:hypothetical protein
MVLLPGRDVTGSFLWEIDTGISSTAGKGSRENRCHLVTHSHIGTTQM